jgi:hypothetical protein
LFRGEVLAAEGLEKRVWTVRKKDGTGLTSEKIPQEVKDKFQ